MFLQAPGLLGCRVVGRLGGEMVSMDLDYNQKKEKKVIRYMVRLWVAYLHFEIAVLCRYSQWDTFLWGTTLLPHWCLCVLRVVASSMCCRIRVIRGRHQFHEPHRSHCGSSIKSSPPPQIFPSSPIADTAVSFVAVDLFHTQTHPPHTTDYW